jgi:integrase
VDSSKQLRAALLEQRDARLLIAMTAGRTVSDELVFPSQAGTVIKADNTFLPLYMEPALEQAGLRRFRFHYLLHTFGSLHIRNGASLAYVKEQIGHSRFKSPSTHSGISFQVLTSHGWIGWIPRQLSNRMQPRRNDPKGM